MHWHREESLSSQGKASSIAPTQAYPSHSVEPRHTHGRRPRSLVSRELLDFEEYCSNACEKLLGHVGRLIKRDENDPNLGDDTSSLIELTRFV